MKYLLRIYRRDNHDMLFMWKTDDGYSKCEKLKDIKKDQLEWMISNPNKAFGYYTILHIFILEDELFNRKIKKIKHGNKQSIFRKILQR